MKFCSCAAAHMKRTGSAHAAKRVLELEPGYTISGMCAALDLHASIAEPLSEALRKAGLQE
jgi:hypothetical protein